MNELKKLLAEAMEAIELGEDPAWIDQQVRILTGYPNLGALQAAAENEDGMLPAEALEDARAKLIAGEPAESVDAAIEKATGFPNIFSLRMAVESSEDARRAQELTDIARRQEERGDSAVEDFATMATHGLSFGLSDEIAGILFGDEAKQERREQIEDLRTAHPGASVAAELAGGFMFPFGIGARAARGGTRAAAAGASRLGRTLRAGGRVAAVGGALGAAGATATGLAEGEGSIEERARDLSLMAPLVGAALGAAGGATASIFSRTARKRGGERLARQTRELAGAEDVTLLRNQLRQRRTRTQELVYRALDRDFPTVDDPAILGRLEEVADVPALRNVLRRRELIPSSLRDGTDLIKEPSFEDLQKIREALRGLGRRGDVRAQGLAEDLNRDMERVFGNRLRVADRVWARSYQYADDINKGRQFWNKSASDVREALADLSPESREYFRQGQLSKIDERLRAGDSAAGRIIKRWAEEGSETLDALRQMFPDEQTFETFRTLVRSERDVQRVVNLYRTLARTALATGVSAGTGAATFGILGRNR